MSVLNFRLIGELAELISTSEKHPEHLVFDFNCGLSNAENHPKPLCPKELSFKSNSDSLNNGNVSISNSAAANAEAIKASTAANAEAIKASAATNAEVIADSTAASTELIDESTATAANCNTNDDKSPNAIGAQSASGTKAGSAPERAEPDGSLATPLTAFSGRATEGFASCDCVDVNGFDCYIKIGELSRRVSNRCCELELSLIPDGTLFPELLIDGRSIQLPRLKKRGRSIFPLYPSPSEFSRLAELERALERRVLELERSVKSLSERVFRKPLFEFPSPELVGKRK